MSRVGKKPVPVPAGVTATVTGQTVKMKGSKGELQFVVPTLVNVAMKDGAIEVEPVNQSKPARSSGGTSRAQIANIATGVSNGFSKKLEITGVGYRAAMAGKALKLSLGYSHDIEYAVPEGITIATPKPTEITITGIDRQKVGQVAAEIRDYRGPEPYKGKGVRYEGEFIFRKEGRRSKGGRRCLVSSKPSIGARRAFVGRSRRRPMAVRVSRCSVRRSRSMLRSSTT